jgi:MFS family permease
MKALGAVAALRHDVEIGAWLLIASAFLASIPSGFLIVSLPIYLDRVGLHPEAIGVLFTISGLASAALLVLFGFLADRHGRKTFIVIGTLVPVSSYAILAFSISHPLLLVASAVGGIGLAGGMSGALVTSGFNALLSDKSNPRVRTALFSIAEMGWVVAVLAGSLLAGVPSLLERHAGLSYRGAYHVMFLVLVGLGIAATLLLLPIREHATTFARRPHWLPRRSGRRIAQLSISLGLLGLALGFIVQLLPLWFHLRFHVGEAFVGPWYGASQLLALGVLAVAAPLSARLGVVRYVVLTQGFSMVALLLIGFSPLPAIAGVFMILRTLGMNGSWPVQQAYIQDIVEPDERATAASLTYACWSVASALTPPIGGFLLSAHHYTAPFVLAGICYVGAIAVFQRCFRDVLPTGGHTLVTHPQPAAE